MPNNNNTAILFSHVTLGYENIVTTPDLNLTIHPGDYICLIGENGSGKSTFVKSLLGLVKPLKGHRLLFLNPQAVRIPTDLQGSLLCKADRQMWCNPPLWFQQLRRLSLSRQG